jgi:hypothetical protein
VAKKKDDNSEICMKFAPQRRNPAMDPISKSNLVHAAVNILFS